MRIASAIVLGLAVVMGASTYALNEPLRRWTGFALWKLLGGRAHGGQYLAAGDVELYCETYGAGPPVLVLHGGLGSIEGMGYQIRALSRRHFVIAVDSRGHGRSSDANIPLSYSLMSGDIVKILDDLKIDRVDVVGWSDGGIVGLDLAIHHPERVGKLVAISANYDVDGLIGGLPSADDIPPAPLKYRLLARNPAHWPILYHEVVTMWRTGPHYTLDDLGRIRAPTLVIAGEKDIIKRDHTDRLARAIPHSQEMIIAGGTHTSPIERPDIVNFDILRFLEAG